MQAKLLSSAAIFAMTGCIFFSINGQEVAAGDYPPTQNETTTMSQDSYSTSATQLGFSYSADLATMFGLAEADAMAFDPPLLGVAMDIRTGIRGGKICTLHVFFDANLDIRLPDAVTLSSISGQQSSLPFALLQKPAADIRQHISGQVRALSNRAIARFGTNYLTGNAQAGDDSKGSYTSMPLDSYHREFVPGVGWLAMQVNCALAASDEYSHLSLFAESNASPPGMILNQQVDPSKMIEFRIPDAFYAGMKPALKAAVAIDDEITSIVDQPKPYRVITLR